MTRSEKGDLMFAPNKQISSLVAMVDFYRRDLGWSIDFEIVRRGKFKSNEGKRLSGVYYRLNLTEEQLELWWSLEAIERMVVGEHQALTHDLIRRAISKAVGADGDDEIA